MHLSLCLSAFFCVCMCACVCMTYMSMCIYNMSGCRGQRLMSGTLLCHSPPWFWVSDRELAVQVGWLAGELRGFACFVSVFFQGLGCRHTSAHLAAILTTWFHPIASKRTMCFAFVIKCVFKSRVDLQHEHSVGEDEEKHSWAPS